MQTLSRNQFQVSQAFNFGMLQANMVATHAYATAGITQQCSRFRQSAGRVFGIPFVHVRPHPLCPNWYLASAGECVQVEYRMGQILYSSVRDGYVLCINLVSTSRASQIPVEGSWSLQFWPRQNEEGPGRSRRHACSG